jgi:hypothetical protein
LKGINIVKDDDPTHDDARESCHREEMQSDVEADAQVKPPKKESL